MTNDSIPFTARQRVGCTDDSKARGTVIENPSGRTVLVRWDFDTNPYGVGAPRRYFEMADRLTAVR
ncbi:hypothetical protein [Mycobacteroides abscessus]|uniref:hypothetical protein n=1 Tax=Mycobacteroides abscessus TaxID=36809 RepID=UPI0009C933A5|nr:hypothetical protein [Mycobacteroides abscessus]SLC72541.1 Uncharacterised protein [Mycobacteroides abscessus subsp. massiliense]SLJ50345.1 Uncharacterised protein [Mycobacteroides abscessus subsp. abscessus]